MEEFIDYILFLALVGVIGLSGLLIFLLLKNPIAGYWLLASYIVTIGGGVGWWAQKWHRKRRLGPYYEILQEISRSKKEIKRTTRRLERHLQRSLTPQFPKINQLSKAARLRIRKILEIDKILFSLNQKQSTSTFFHAAKKLQESDNRYQKNIQAIERSKHHYFEEVQQILRILHELNSQILALKFSHEQATEQSRIVETIDELLIDMQVLDEIQ